MSFYDLSKLSPEELIAQFVLESKNSGAFLSYNDYKIIEHWLEVSNHDADLVLFLLSEEFEKGQQELGSKKKYSQSLKILEKKISNKIIKAKTKI